MLKNKIIVAIVGVICSVVANGAFAASNTNPTTIDGISIDALEACKDKKENDTCMYIKSDTKFTGSCQKKDDKLTCVPN